MKTFEAETSILLATRKGVVKKTELQGFSAPRRKGVYAINIDEGDEVIAARLTHSSEQVMLFTKNGMAVRFDQEQVRAYGAHGVALRVNLRNEGDGVVSRSGERGRSECTHCMREWFCANALL